MLLAAELLPIISPASCLPILDERTNRLLRDLKRDNPHRLSFTGCLAFYYYIDFNDHSVNKAGPGLTENNLMFFGLEERYPTKRVRSSPFLRTMAPTIVKQLLSGKCPESAGCEIHMFTNGRKEFGKTRAIATLLNGWDDWDFSLKNYCSYEELAWMIKKMEEFNLLPPEK